MTIFTFDRFEIFLFGMAVGGLVVSVGITFGFGLLCLLWKSRLPAPEPAPPVPGAEE